LSRSPLYSNPLSVVEFVESSRTIVEISVGFSDNLERINLWTQGLAQMHVNYKEMCAMDGC